MLARSVSALSISAVLMTGLTFRAQAQVSETGVEQVPQWAHPSTDYDASRSVTWDTSSAPAQLPPSADAPPTPTVTVHELRHEIPGKAMREWNRAAKAYAQGKSDSAVQHLNRAIEIDPEFVAARNNLGAMYLQQHKVKEAEAVLVEATRVDPHNYQSYSNLSLAYMMMNDMDDAEHMARRAMDLDRGSTRARFIVGMCLVMRQKYTPEAERLLARSESDYPQAKLLLAQVEASRGELKEAKSNLHAYLESGDATARETAEHWLRIIAKAEGEAAVQAVTARR